MLATLFPTHYGQAGLTDETIDYYVGNTLGATLTVLTEQVRRGLLFASVESDPDQMNAAGKAATLTRAIISDLPALRDLLSTDLQAAFHGDPAATSIAEVLLCYPGTIAVIHYRLAHSLLNHGAPFMARMISDIAHSLTGIDIHPGARIGGSFFIDHGTGVVIGETAIIGKGVRLYQAVTLGAKRFPVDDAGALVKGKDRHPIVEDDVVIYAGARFMKD